MDYIVYKLETTSSYINARNLLALLVTTAVAICMKIQLAKASYSYSSKIIFLHLLVSIGATCSLIIKFHQCRQNED